MWGTRFDDNFAAVIDFFFITFRFIEKPEQAVFRRLAKRFVPNDAAMASPSAQVAKA